MNPIKLIDGHKTHLGAIAYGVLAVLVWAKVVTVEQALPVAGLVEMWSKVAIRHAIAKAGK